MGKIPLHGLWLLYHLYLECGLLSAFPISEITFLVITRWRGCPLVTYYQNTSVNMQIQSWICYSCIYLGLGISLYILFHLFSYAIMSDDIPCRLKSNIGKHAYEIANITLMIFFWHKSHWQHDRCETWYNLEI